MLAAAGEIHDEGPVVGAKALRLVDAIRKLALMPALPSVGFRHILVNGVPVVVDGVIKDGSYPGRAARGPIRGVTP